MTRIINTGILNRFIDHPPIPPEEVSISFNFIQDPSAVSYTYTYIAPYAMVINTKEVNRAITYTIVISGNPYELGATINKFDEVVITLSDYGLLVLSGVKL